VFQIFEVILINKTVFYSTYFAVLLCLSVDLTHGDVVEVETCRRNIKWQMFICY